MVRFDAETFAPLEQLAHVRPVVNTPTVESQGPVALFYSDYEAYRKVESTQEVMADVRGRVGGEAAVTLRATCIVCTSHRAARDGMTYGDRPTKNEANEGEQ